VSRFDSFEEFAAPADVPAPARPLKWPTCADPKCSADSVEFCDGCKDAFCELHLRRGACADGEVRNLCSDCGPREQDVIL